MKHTNIDIRIIVTFNDIVIALPVSIVLILAQLSVLTLLQSTLCPVFSFKPLLAISFIESSIFLKSSLVQSLC